MKQGEEEGSHGEPVGDVMIALLKACQRLSGI